MQNNLKALKTALSIELKKIHKDEKVIKSLEKQIKEMESDVTILNKNSQSGNYKNDFSTKLNSQLDNIP